MVVVIEREESVEGDDGRTTIVRWSHKIVSISTTIWVEVAQRNAPHTGHQQAECQQQ